MLCVSVAFPKAVNRFEILDFRFSIKTRSHLRKFHQKCDRSVCCLTIRPLEPVNNREQSSIIQSKIENRKSKIDRSHLRNFHQKCDRSVCCLTLRTLHPLNNREQKSIDFRLGIFDWGLKPDCTCGNFTKNAICQSAVGRLGPSIPLRTRNRSQLFNRKSKIPNRKSIDYSI